eukprot:455978-Prymnesium_polylepis.1
MVVAADYPQAQAMGPYMDTTWRAVRRNAFAAAATTRRNRQASTHSSSPTPSGSCASSSASAC